uniref:Dirigent protein n=1 Tax=Aegilops tauschii TaxID=37682 RepID=M8BTH1_AEGTA
MPFLILTILVLSLQCYASVASPLVRDKETNILFYLHNIHADKDSSSVLVAQNANATAHARGIVAFSSVYVFDVVITEGPSIASKVLGNAQGMNPLRSTRELPVIGGRGAFRMAQGYGMLRTLAGNLEIVILDSRNQRRTKYVIIKSKKKKKKHGTCPSVEGKVVNGPAP